MNRFIGAFRVAVFGLASALIAACGGSSDTPVMSAAPPAALETTVVSGTLTGFGGVVVDGVRYGEANAVAAFDVDPSAESPATMADLKLGQQVEASLDKDGNCVKVIVRSTVIGPVQSIDTANNSFKAVGQTVKVIVSGEGMTVFEGVTGLAAMKVDDWVEVHGTLDNDKNVVATRVEVKPAAGTVAVRAGGIVKELNETAKTFKLGDLTINYAGAMIKPEGAKIENDVLVFVYSDQLPTGTTLVAKAVRVGKQPTLEGRRFVIGGLVTDAAADGKSFKVNGIKVDAAGAELKGGQNPTFADIKNMALVRVEGTLNTSAGGVTLKATRVWVIPASEQRRVMLIGQVTDFVSAASFKVRGVPVNADMATFKNGVKADLKDGAFVDIKGRVDGQVVKADEVRIDTPPRNLGFRLFGVVSDYVAADKTFKLLGIPMKLSDTATFENGVLADFSNGDVVEVKGSFDGTVFLVSEVEFKPNAFNPLIFAEGSLSMVTATGFQLNGATFKIDAQTEIRNGPLANGQRVEVTAQWVAGELIARKVEVQLPSATVRLMGPITDYVSKADFKVAGQSVDASAAMFFGGAEGDLANGKLVRVSGALVAGKVKATSVTFMR